MFDKLLDNVEYMMGGLAVILLALICYGLGSQAKEAKVCQQIGGVYVQTYSGYKCLHVTEIDL
jgi:hypothetical protein